MNCTASSPEALNGNAVADLNDERRRVLRILARHLDGCARSYYWPRASRSVS